MHPVDKQQIFVLIFEIVFVHGLVDNLGFIMEPASSPLIISLTISFCALYPGALDSSWRTSSLGSSQSRPYWKLFPSCTACPRWSAWRSGGTSRWLFGLRLSLHAREHVILNHFWKWLSYPLLVWKFSCSDVVNSLVAVCWYLLLCPICWTAGINSVLSIGWYLRSRGCLFSL